MNFMQHFFAVTKRTPVLQRMVRGVSLAAIVMLTLTSCELSKNQLTYDRSAEADRQDFRDTLSPREVPDVEFADVPEFTPVVATPEDLRLPSPLVTVSVNNTVSLRDLLFELAEQADVDLELDPQIRGSVIFTAKDRPFDEVIARLCEMSGLRYTFEKNVLRVEVDRPYNKNYNIDYVNAVRTASSRMQGGVALGGGGSETGASNTGGSQASIESSYDTDIWEEVQANIEQILASTDTYTSLATLADPVVTPISTFAPAPMPTNPEDPSSVPPVLPGSPQVTQMSPAVAPTLQVNAGLSEPLVPNPPATFSISRQSGMLSVFASERQHRAIKKYLDEFARRITTQVLIEAKVLQVDLTDEYATGIDWDQIKIFDTDINFSANFPTPGLNPTTSSGVTLTIDKGDLSAVVTAVSRFGTVRALSSPRITVLNNQPALINVAQNNTYFSFDVETEDDSDTGETRFTVDSEQRSAPEGVIMNVLPSANPTTGEILLSLRPSVSRITGSINDPTIPFILVSQGLDPTQDGVPANNIPQVSVQEIDSILKVQSGQVVVMGGLMRDGNSVTDTSIPVLGDLPYVGNLFKSHNDTIEKSELVILIRAQIVAGSNVDDVDRELFQKFSGDRRPARM